MRSLRLLVAVLTAAIVPMAAVDAGGPPAQWELRQNEPNPFCPGQGTTVIEFAAPEAADVTLVILAADGSETVVRTLADGSLQAGFYTLLWDGRDDAGEFVPDGSYPYRLTATESGTGALIFEDEKVATLACATPSEDVSWGRVKARFASP